MYYLGGMTITKTGWLGPQAVFVDFVSTYTTGWLWQLYANRSLIGHTVAPTERRVVGQLQPSDSPAPLTLVRVDPANARTNYGASLPALPWNRYALQWSAASYPADADHFEITGATVAGGAVDSENVIGNVPCIGDGAYQFVLPPFRTAGTWTFSITPRDDASPSGNAGTASTVAIAVAVPPPDLEFQADGNRFTASIAAGVLTVGFSYG